MNSILFSVKVPVLSVNTYSTWKKCTTCVLSNSNMKYSSFSVLNLLNKLIFAYTTVCWEWGLLCYLSQLLIQVWGVDHSSLPELIIKHLIVPHDEVRAQKLLHLHRDVHWDGNDVVEKNHEGQEVCECPDQLGRRSLDTLKGEGGKKYHLQQNFKTNGIWDWGIYKYHSMECCLMLWH